MLLILLSLSGKVNKVMLEICNIKKLYKTKKAIEEISFKVNDGEVVALIGKNGAGKTTILNSIAGYIYPTVGEIKFNGKNILIENEIKKRFGILIDANFFDYLNVNDNLMLLLKSSGVYDKEYSQKMIDSILEQVGLIEQKYKKVKSFSFGMKQRLGLAQALIMDIDFLMLDEPFVGLDPVGKELFKSIIKTKAKKDKIGVLFSSHDLADIEDICDRVVMIREGKIIYNNVFNKQKKYCLSLKSDVKLSSELEQLVSSGKLTIDNLTAIWEDKELIDILLKNNEIQEAGFDDLTVYENSLIELFNE